MRKERHKSKIFYIVMFVIVAVVCLGLFFGYFLDRTRKNPFKRAQLKIEGDWPFERGKEAGYISVKNGSTIIANQSTDINYNVFTDNRGARVNTEGIQIPEQVDILTIGGSFAWGAGVENIDTFTERLGRKMNLSVANMALAGYGTVQSLQMLKGNMDLKPKVVIYAFIYDHIRRNLSPCAPSYAPFCRPVSYLDLTEDDGKPYIHLPRMEYFTPELNKKFFKEVMMKDESEGIGLTDILWRARIDLFRFKEMRNIGRTDSASRKASMVYLIDEMNKVVKSNNAKLIVLYIPMLTRERTPPPAVELLNAFTGDIIFIDMAPIVTKHYANKDNPLLRFKKDGHPNSLAHVIMAEEIERVMRENNLFKGLN